MTDLKSLLPNGLTHEIITSGGGRFIIRDKRPAITMPTMAGYQNRIIFLDKRGSKYKWAEKDAPHPPLFMRIPEGSKIAVITNGEKATLVLAQQNIAACNTFGEGNEIEAAVAALKVAGVVSLLLVPDCDEAGLHAAEKWRVAAETAGLELGILDIGAYLRRAYFMEPPEYHKWDLRDLWLLLDQDAELFQEVLFKRLPHLDFNDYQEWLKPPDTSEKRFRPSSANLPAKSDNLKAYRQWWENEVLTRVSATAPHGNIHRHQKCLNPNHADHNPSFRITKTLNPICTCEEGRKHANIARWVGAVSWENYREAHGEKKVARPNHNTRKVKKVAPVKRSKYADVVAIPAALRKPMIKDGLTNVCRIIDVLLFNGVSLDCAFTRRDIVLIMDDYNLKKSGIYRAFEALSQILNAVLSGEMEHSNFGNPSDYGLYYSIEGILSVLGKHYGYSIRTAGDLLHNHESTLASAKEYRQYTLLENLPVVEQNLSLKEIGEDMGLSAGTVSSYARELRDQGLVSITQHYKYRELQADDFPRLSVVLEEWKTTYSNSYIEMYSVEGGLRTPYHHKGGKRGIPNNRIPALYSVVMLFFQKSLKRHIIKSVKNEQSNLTFVLVSKMRNSYRRLPVPAMKNPVLGRLMEGIAA